jgi:hydroxyethylthiazole kinase-like uncharacterized protein yjeF
MTAPVLDSAWLAARLPERPAEGHKGTFGHLLIIAGAPGYTGAAKLAVEAAGRSGVGLVTLAMSEAVAPIIAAGLLEATWLTLPSSSSGSIASSALQQALEAADTRDAVMMGPGLTQDDSTAEFVRAFSRQCSKPLLIDADGLNNLAGNAGSLKEAGAPRVLTPHPGEMARLMGATTDAVQADREESAQNLAKNTGSVVVLKGHRTVIASSGEIALNETGNSGMGSGGTGDVLAGLIGGLLAQGMDAFDAACAGVYLHGLAGDLAAGYTTERALLARDLLEALPDAWKTLEA